MSILKQLSLFVRPGLNGLAGVILITGVSVSAPGSAYSGGINASGYASVCSTCHYGTSYPSISISGSSWIKVGTSAAYTLTVTSTNGGLTRSGFNAWVSAGALSPNEAGVYEVATGVVTHTASKANNAQFAFYFDAPGSLAGGNTATITGWGNNVDNDGLAYESEDSAAGTTRVISLCLDADNDGYYTSGSGAGCPNTSDCNDGNSGVNPGASDVCDGVNNDCDGSTDENATFVTYYRDVDGDGYGNIAVTTSACGGAPGGYVANSTDCNDTNGAIHPGVSDTCDGINNDCDGSTDENATFVTYYRDADSDTYGNSGLTQNVCSGAPAGYVANSTDCNDSCSSCTPVGTEVCDGVDNNCNGNADESTSTDAATWYADTDGDNYGNPSSSVKACSQPGGYRSNNTDCDDTRATRYPGGTEICDNLDNDCSGATAVDVGCDDDGDDYCDIGMGIVSAPSVCPSGGNDCDDTKATRHPGHSEDCDGLDNDCSGATAVDVGCDDDNDDYCEIGKVVVGTPAVCPTGRNDCKDTCNSCYPTAPEICDGEDNDCNGTTDDTGAASSCGLGICAASAMDCGSCTPGPAGTESCANFAGRTDDDCDGDANELGHLPGGAAIYEGDPGCSTGLPGVCAPGTYGCSGSSQTCNVIIAVGAQTEICDNLDNDCDGQTDEGCDDDNDDYCDSGMTVFGIPTTCASGSNDCNDSAGTGASIRPGAPETCANQAVDNDCDGNANELANGIVQGTGCTSSSPGVCAAGGYTCSGTVLTCLPIIPVGTQTEICDDLDNDCDGAKDDGLPNLTCGVGACANSVPACTAAGANNVCAPLSSSGEICDDLDNNCNGEEDEGCDDDGDGYCDETMLVSGSPTTCQNGASDCDDDFAQSYPGAGELCDSDDNDCDGQTDEVVDISEAECGLGICHRVGTTCEASSCTPGTPETEICDDLDNDCDGDVDEGCDDDDDGYCDALMTVVDNPAICALGQDDCDDDVDSDFPGALEVCDLVDNDCDTEVDEVSEVPLAVCGTGNCARTGATCDPASCVAGAPLPETCDGIDNDCDGLPDDGLPPANCGEGVCKTQGTSCLPASCLPLEPDVLETCDSLDNDCDGQIDNGCDDDNDEYCDFSLSFVDSSFCPNGPGDCNDLLADAYPGAPELCDNADNNCDGSLDEDVEESFCGVGACVAMGTSCAPGGVAVNCDPGEPADEECDGIDNDCNGTIDDGLVETSCGVGQCLVVIAGCSGGAEIECVPLEASDETCDGLDNDCDGVADNDAFCMEGECIAGRCVSDEEIEAGDPGDGPVTGPDAPGGDEDGKDEDGDGDGDRWLTSTAGASAGGAASVPEPEIEEQASTDRGSCSVENPGARKRGNVGWLVLALLGCGLSARTMSDRRLRQSKAA